MTRGQRGPAPPRAGVPIRDWRAGEQPASVAAHPPIYAATEFNVRNRARQHGEVHVQEAQNAVMLEQDRLMDRIKAGEEATDRSDDDVYCARLACFTWWGFVAWTVRASLPLVCVLCGLAAVIPPFEFSRGHFCSTVQSGHD